MAASNACRMIDKKEGWYGILNLYSEDNGCVENGYGVKICIDSIFTS